MINRWCLVAVLLPGAWSAVCNLYQGYDCYGNDITNAGSNTAQDCCDMCAANSQCNGFTWTRTQKICYMKTICSSRTQCDDCTAGEAHAPTPAPRPPTAPTGPTPAPPPTANIRVVQSSQAGDRFATNTDIPWNGPPTPSMSSITVDPSAKFQEIFGFGGAFTEATGYNMQRVSAATRQQITNHFFGDPAVSNAYTVCRVHMNSCDFSLASYSCNDAADDFNLANFNINHDHMYLIPAIQAAQANVVAAKQQFKLFLSPWSPPAWMKSNNDMCGSNSPGLKNDPRVYKAWALHFTKFIDAYKKEANIDFWGATVQNEPEYAAGWEACVYNAQQEGEFVRDYLGPQLRATHPEVKLMIFDHNRDHVADWAKAILSQPDMEKYVDGTAFHWYSNGGYDNLDAAHNVNTSKFLLATEGCNCGGVSLNDWGRGETYGLDIISDLNHWSSGWVDWNLVLDTTGGPNHLGNLCDGPIIVDPAKDSYFLQPSFYFMGHFSKFIQPGARRISSSVLGSLHAVAAVNPDGTTVLVVLNIDNTDTAFTLKAGGRVASSVIPAHSIQSLKWSA